MSKFNNVLYLVTADETHPYRTATLETEPKFAVGRISVMYVSADELRVVVAMGYLI